MKNHRLFETRIIETLQKACRREKENMIQTKWSRTEINGEKQKCSW